MILIGNSGLTQEQIATLAKVDANEAAIDNIHNNQITIKTNTTNGQLIVKPKDNASQGALIRVQGARTASTVNNTAHIRFENYDLNISTIGYLGAISGLINDTINNTGGLAFYIYPNGSISSEALAAFISSDGNFGINKADPTAKLHVDGDVKFEGLDTGTTSEILYIDPNSHVIKRGAMPTSGASYGSWTLDLEHTTTNNNPFDIVDMVETTTPAGIVLQAGEFTIADAGSYLIDFGIGLNSSSDIFIKVNGVIVETLDSSDTSNKRVSHSTILPFNADDVLTIILEYNKTIRQGSSISINTIGANGTKGDTGATGAKPVYYGCWEQDELSVSNSQTTFADTSTVNAITSEGISHEISTGKFTVENTGIYNIDVALCLLNTNNTSNQALTSYLRVNSIIKSEIHGWTKDNVRTNSVVINRTLVLNAGDYITITHNRNVNSSIGCSMNITTVLDQGIQGSGAYGCWEVHTNDTANSNYPFWGDTSATIPPIGVSYDDSLGLDSKFIVSNTGAYKISLSLKVKADVGKQTNIYIKSGGTTIHEFNPWIYTNTTTVATVFLTTLTAGDYIWITADFGLRFQKGTTITIEKI